MDKDDQSWIIKLSCPYCGEVIVTASNFGMIPRDMSEDKREEITCGEAGFDNVDMDSCGHLAFFSDWAYAGHFVMDNWESEMAMLASAMADEEEDQPESNVTGQDTARIIVDGLDCRGIEEVDRIIAKALPRYDHKYAEEYVEKFDGISRGGPTYRLIFLRKKNDNKIST
jgi:hypothetical protein